MALVHHDDVMGIVALTALDDGLKGDGRCGGGGDGELGAGGPTHNDDQLPSLMLLLMM